MCNDGVEMSISSISQFIAGNQQELQKTAAKDKGSLEKLAQTVERSVFGEGYDSSISDAQQLQSRAGGFRKAAANAAQAGDVLQVADKALAQIARKLSLFKDAADLSGDSISKLKSDIASIVDKTEFAGSKLFAVTGGYEGVSLPVVSADNLLADLSADSLDWVDPVIEVINSYRQMIADQRGDAETVAAFFEVSAQNQEASKAIFPAEGELSLLEQVVSGNQSVSAQTGRLQPDILGLLQA